MHANSQPSYGCGGFRESDSVDTDTKLGCRVQDGVSNRGRTCKLPKVTRADAGLVAASSITDDATHCDEFSLITSPLGQNGPISRLQNSLVQETALVSDLALGAIDVTHKKVHFTVLSYNAQSLMSDERFVLLFNDLQDVHWDLIAFSETWREKTEESWTTEHGHTFCGSGGTRGSNGTGFLLHRRWAFECFQTCSERVSHLDLHVAGHGIRVLAVYMPHGQLSDTLVDEVYTRLDSLILSARRRGYKVIAAGDFNAQLGSGDETYTLPYVGTNCRSTRNARGELLLNWCQTHELAAANTYYNVTWNDTWTWRSNCLTSQLDYILVDLNLFASVATAGVDTRIDIGSSHRCVFALFYFASVHASTVLARIVEPLRALDKTKYHSQLKTLLVGTDCPLRVHALEHVMVSAAQSSQLPKERTGAACSETQLELRSLIDRRKLLAADSTLTVAQKLEGRKVLCKKYSKVDT